MKMMDSLIIFSIKVIHSCFTLKGTTLKLEYPTIICFSAVFVALVGAEDMLVIGASSTLIFTCGKDPGGASPAVSVS